MRNYKNGIVGISTVIVALYQGSMANTPETDGVLSLKREPVVLVASQNADSSSEQVSNDTLSKEPVLSLDKMVISATRTKRRMSETPASVTVISRSEIENSPARDINDLVANKTGVQVRRYVGMGEGVPSDISMRGIPGAMAASRTLILVDGIPTNASGTPFLILNEIPVEIIETIEIVRGPYSSLYGANAFGGVINVITKKGDGKHSSSATFESSYPFSTLETWLDEEPIREAVRTGARQALWNGDVMTSGGNEKMRYLVNCGYRTIGNYLLNDSALVKATDHQYLVPARNYDYEDLRLFGKFGYQVNNRLSVELHSRYFNSDLGFGVTRYTPYQTDIDIEGEKIIFGPQVMYRISDNIDVKAGGYFRRVNASYMNELGGSFIKWKANSNDWQVDMQTIMRLFDGHVVTIGSEFLSNGITFGDISDKLMDTVITKGASERISNGGAYIQDEMVLFNHYRIVPGVRVDYQTVFGLALSPKLGILVPLCNAFRVRSSVGRAFRAPNHAELYLPPIPLKDTIPLRSNPDLDPEYIWSFDGGLEYVPIPGFRAQWGLFYNDMRDLIGQGIRIYPPTATTGLSFDVTHQNISSAWSAGSEIELEWRIVPPVSVRCGYVYQKSKNKSASKIAAYFKKENLGRVKEDDIALDYIPGHKGTIGVLFTKNVGNATWSLSVDEMFVGTRHYLNFSQISLEEGDITIDDYVNWIAKVAPPYEKLPAYARTDLQIRCAIGRFFGTVAVQNCFNAEYEESYGTYATGTLATLKIGVHL